MALDHNILLQARTPSVLEAIQSAQAGLSIGQRIREQPMREALMREQIANQQFQRHQSAFGAQLDAQRLALKKQELGSTSSIKEYQHAVAQGYAGSYIDYQQMIKKAGATTVENNFNPSGDRQAPTKTVQSQIQKSVLSAEKELRNLDKIADTHSDEFLTTVGRIKSGVGRVLDKMGSDALGLADFNAERTKFANAAKQMFNQYRKEITGAAASEKEMKDLLESMFNESQGPKEFKASFDLFMEKAQENLRLARENAREGIDVSEGAGNNSNPLSDADLFKKYGIE